LSQCSEDNTRCHPAGGLTRGGRVQDVLADLGVLLAKKLMMFDLTGVDIVYNTGQLVTVVGVGPNVSVLSIIYVASVTFCK